MVEKKFLEIYRIQWQCSITLYCLLLDSAIQVRKRGGWRWCSHRPACKRGCGSKCSPGGQVSTGRYRRITVEELEGITGISDRSVRRILKDVLGFHKVSARWVPRMLTAQQKRLRKEISEDSIDTYSSDILKFLRRFVTMDEVWVYHYDPETKEQSKEWRKPEEGAPRKFRSVASTRKILACFLGHWGYFVNSFPWARRNYHG